MSTFVSAILLACAAALGAGCARRCWRRYEADAAVVYGAVSAALAIAALVTLIHVVLA